MVWLEDGEQRLWQPPHLSAAGCSGPQPVCCLGSPQQPVFRPGDGEQRQWQPPHPTDWKKAGPQPDRLLGDPQRLAIVGRQEKSSLLFCLLSC